MPSPRTRTCTSLEPRPSMEVDDESNGKARGTVCLPSGCLTTSFPSVPSLCRPDMDFHSVNRGFIHGRLQHRLLEDAVADWWDRL